MKRYLFAALLVITTLLPLYSSSDRCGWWNNRIQSLHKDRETMCGSKNPDPAMIALLDQEIAEARNVLLALEGPPEGGRVPQEEVRSQADDIARAVTALVFMEETTGEFNKKSFNEKCQAMLVRNIDKMILDRFGRESQQLRDLILATDVSDLEKKTLACEMYLGSAISLYHSRMDEAAGIARKTEDTVMKDKNVRPSEVSVSVADAVFRYLGGKGQLADNGPSDESLSQSWTWKRISSIADARFRHYRQIMAQSDSLNSAPLERVRYYHNNPVQIEGAMFSEYHVDGAVTAAKEIQCNGVTIKIPPDPDFKATSLEIDRARRLHLTEISGREKDEFFNNVDSEMSGMVKNGLQTVADIYSAEEEKLRSLEEMARQDDDLNLACLEEFRAARRSFSLRYGRLVARKNRSMDLLHLVSAIRAGHGPVVAASCEYQQKRLNEYLSYMNELSANCTRLPAYDSQGMLGRRYTKVWSRADSMSRFFAGALSIEDKYPVINPGADNAILLLKKNGKADIAASGKSTDTAKKDFIKVQKDLAVIKTRVQKEDPAAAAKTEIAAMVSSMGRYTALIAEYREAEKLIGEYQDVYLRLEEQASGGDESADLINAIERKSILPLIGSYNSAKIQNERSRREYLRREGLSGIARLITLGRAYRQKGVDLQSFPADGTLAEWKSILSSRKEVKIASWRMDESSIEEVDARAVARLEQISHRAMWRSSADTSDGKTGITLNGINISLLVPRGWAREDSSSAASGISFRSPDGSSCITVVNINGDRPSLGMEVENLSLKSGSMVMKKWGKRDGADFYYVLAKGKNDSLRETYGTVHEGRMFLITGETRKDRYNLFSPILRKVFDTVEFI